DSRCLPCRRLHTLKPTADSAPSRAPALAPPVARRRIRLASIGWRRPQAAASRPFTEEASSMRFPSRPPVLVAAALVAALSFAAAAWFTTRPAPAVASKGEDDSVSAHLGGAAGIRAFLEQKAVPAILADPELAPFFTHLTETPGDIEDCLSRLLDHDLGGPS